jgi:hypothetical protein
VLENMSPDSVDPVTLPGGMMTAIDSAKAWRRESHQTHQTDH